MSGKNPRLSSLESRKQLLLAESELNRAQLVQELRSVAERIRPVTDRAEIIRSLVADAAGLIAGLAFFRRQKSAGVEPKPSWWQTLLKGAQLAGALWSGLRPSGHEPNDK